MMLHIIAALFLIVYTVSAQTEIVKGRVADSDSNEPLGYASILIANTASGTISNSDGFFTIKLKPGNYSLITRYVGYTTDTSKIILPLKNDLIIKLVRRPVNLSEIIVTDENPAYRIIRKAVERKKLNKEGLKNFEYNVYSKKIFESAGEIAAVEEAFIKGYNNLPEWEKEFILKIYKTENQKKSKQNMEVDFTDNYYIDFSADEVTLLMNKVYLPLADNTFDYYDFKLQNRIEKDIHPVYVIEIIPRSKIQPLVEGTIFIDGESYSICKVDLTTSEGVRFPYVQNLKLEFKQSLGKHSGYWLPDYVEINASLTLNFGGLLALDPLTFHEVNSITDYNVNKSIPDSVLNAVRSDFGGYTSDTSKNKKKPAEISANEIESLRPIPLTDDEKHAYSSLDSTKTIEKTIKVKGVLASLVPEPGAEKKEGKSFFSSAANLVTSYLYFNNNRVENLSFGLKYSRNVVRNINVKTFGAYSSGLKKSLGELAVNFNQPDFFLNIASIEIFHRTKEWQPFHPYSHYLNSAAVTLGLEDHFNYFLSTGFNIGLGVVKDDRYSAMINFISEMETTVKAGRYASIINSRRSSRENPGINEARDKHINFSFQLGKSPFQLQFIPENGLLFNADWSSKIMDSGFDYYKLFISGQLKTKTFFDELFLSPFLIINVNAALVNGSYGIQHIISPVTALSFYSPAGTLKGIKPYQYTGNKMIAVNIEHNWRTIIFQALGIDFLTNMDIDITTGLSVMKTSNSSPFFKEIKQDKVYYEGYAGISRILGLIKLDFYYNSHKNYGLTINTAAIF